MLLILVSKNLQDFLSSPYFVLLLILPLFLMLNTIGHMRADNMDRALKKIITLHAWLVFLHYFPSNGMSVRGEHVGRKISEDHNPGKY